MVAINLSITLKFNYGVLNEQTPKGVVLRRSDSNDSDSGHVIRPEVRRAVGMDGRLYTACATGNLPLLQQLAAVDPDILNQLVPSSGKTLLHVAVESGQLAIVRYLLANRPELVDETYGSQRLTPLHLAAKNGETDIIRAILDEKLKAIKEVTSAGENIFHLMAKNGQHEAFRCTYLAYNPRKYARKSDEHGNTVLHLSVMKRSMELIDFILKETVVRVNTRNEERKTALDIAIEEHNHPEFGRMIAALREAHCTTGRVGRFWSRREAPDKHLHGVLNTTVVAAALIATLAFSALLNPPGGVYQEGALAGRAILSTHRLFDVFLFFNVIALLTSLAIVVMQSTYVAFTRDRLICRWDVSQTLTDLSAICILIDYVIGAWLIYCPTTKKFPVMITVSALVFASIGATVVNYLLRKLRIRRELNMNWAIDCTS
ncbi:ankyrin repeat-containing protein ITN1-like [Nymphaea colorata]|uniref:ankyrin repeat-containing protein ITN1-like n=1 Tax=Nymphaea colorata TaxID=210225 RepID=UPI00129EF51C|nr:ankyrin repeat-containing protein ITN1-like [Nymphaea colorata]